MSRVDNTIAWAWVLSHARLIKQTAMRFASDTGVNEEDFHSELVIRIAEKHKSFNESLSAPSTWIWWQAKAVAKVMVHKRRRRKNEVQVEEWHHPKTVNTGQYTIELARIKQVATESEWLAATAVAAGFKGAELGAICQCAPFSAKRRVSRLIERMEMM